MRDARTTAGAPASTRLGAIQAWTWNGVQVAGAPARLYVGYTSSGPLVAHLRGGTGGRTCSALDTLELSGPRPVPLTAVEAIRTELRSALATLHTRWIQGRERLAGAPVASKQAAEARALEGTFTTASSAISEISTPPGTTDLAPVVSVLDDIAGSYSDLAEAIEADDRTSFGAARQAITASEAQVRPAIAAASIP